MAYKEKKYSKLKWFHTHRFRILFMAFITIIPLTIILLSYVGNYTSNAKVIFDTETQEEIRSFDRLDQLDIISLDFEWNTLRNAVFTDEGNIQTTGYYQFTFTYEAASTYDVTTVSLIPVLQTNWIDYSSLGSSVTLNNDDDTSIVIGFNYELPQRTLIFINVTDPILYLQVTVYYETGGTTQEEVSYVKIKLKDYNPNTVL